MTDFLVLGTDTDAGKTTFALLWLALFVVHYGYLKPLDTGEPDSDNVRTLVPGVYLHPAIYQFPEPVAPLKAARMHGKEIASAKKLALQKPNDRKSLLIETFGS